jgi:uncharacterized protein YecE (DUF72 family)
MASLAATVRVGTAGWNVPREHAGLCGLAGSDDGALVDSQVGSHLQRYATVCNCAEVNSSFYRAHARKVWERWAATVPDEFRFAVKAPKAITHEAKLVDCGGLLTEFFAQVTGLGEKLGPVLFQLPPKNVFDDGVAREFLGTLREVHGGPVALEARNPSWFEPGVSRLLREYGVARVAADPAKGSALAAAPGGELGLRYFRWHGSPRTYWSNYEAERLEGLAEALKGFSGGESWVIFDNTAAGAAFANADALRRMIG